MKKLLIVMVLGASAVAASAQSLQPRRTMGSRLARPAQTVSQTADFEKDREARKVRASQRSQFGAGSLTAEFERERDTLFMDIVNEAEICQTNLAMYATYPYWPDAMGVVSNFCEKENCVVVDVGHHFGAWKQGSWWKGSGKNAYVVRSNLEAERWFVPQRWRKDGFCVISRGGSYTNFVYSGVGSVCCYDSDGRFVEMYDSLDKIPGMKQCFDDELKVNYAEQDRWMKAHGFAEEGSGREAENRLDAARTNVIDRLKSLRTILSSFPQWRSDNQWYGVCDVGAGMGGPSRYGEPIGVRPLLGGLRRPGSKPSVNINTNDEVLARVNERFECLGRKQDKLIETVVRDLTGLEFGVPANTNGVLDLKFNLGSYETCTFGASQGNVNSVTLIAEFEPSCEQKTIHEKLDQSLSTLLSSIGMDRDALTYNESPSGTRPQLGGLRRQDGNQDWKSVQSFSRRFTISRNKKPSGEYCVTISDQRKVDVPAANNDARRTGGLLGGGSLRARRLQRQQEAQAAAAKQQAEQAARDAERQAQAELEKQQREAERAEQRQQLLAIQEELRRVREAKAAAEAVQGRSCESFSTCNQTSTPSIRKEAFKAKLTGVAIIEGGRMCGYESRALKAAFQSPDSPMEIPYGKAACFRVEYDFPEGYQARVWTRGRWQKGQDGSGYYFGSNPSPLYKGKGIAYGFLDMLERGKTCTLKQLAIGTNAEPKLEGLSNGWDIVVTPVDIKFHGPEIAQKASSKEDEKIVLNNKSQGTNSVADKLQGCDFLLNKDFKKNAKFYLCLFSASWCPPCRREMPRIAKTYVETLKDDPDIELVQFSRDQDDEKALAWAKEHDVTFPVVKPNGGNPLDLHSRGIPHLFIVRADGTLVEEGHPMRIFNEEKFRELKGNSAADARLQGDNGNAASCNGKEPCSDRAASKVLASNRPFVTKEEIRRLLTSAQPRQKIVVPHRDSQAELPVFTNPAEAQRKAKELGLWMFVYNMPCSRSDTFSGSSYFLKSLSKHCVFVHVKGFGSESAECPWERSTCWPCCRILDADGNLISSVAKWSGMPNCEVSGQKMAEIFKGFMTAFEVMPSAFDAVERDPNEAGLAKLHDALSSLPESFVNIVYLKWAELLVKVDRSGERGWRSCYSYADKISPLVKEFWNLNSCGSDYDYRQAKRGKKNLHDVLSRIDREAFKRRVSDSEDIRKRIAVIDEQDLSDEARFRLKRFRESVDEECEEISNIQKDLLAFEKLGERKKDASPAGTGANSSGSVENKLSQNKISVADKLMSCDFLLNKDFKKNAKFYLCLFSASWCPPCRAEMPRIAKTYAETLKEEPDIELIHFSHDQNDEKAMAWAKEHDVKFPVVKPKGGNPLDLHSRGIPHLFIVKADGTLLEEGHPMRIFNEEKFREIKSGNMKPRTADADLKSGERTEQVDGYAWTYRVENGGATIVAAGGKRRCTISPSPKGSVTIPSKLGGVNVTKIGSEAFCECSGITSVTFPASVKEISWRAFSDCRSLSSVSIPSGVVKIYPAAFSGCKSLTAITVSDENMQYASRDGILFDKGMKTLVCYPGGIPGAYVIPSGVTEIGGNAFSGCSGLTSVIVPDSVTRIGEFAFSQSRGLASVALGSGVTMLGQAPFYWCSGLTSITVSEANRRYASRDGVLFDKDMKTVVCCPGGFSGEYVIPSSVTAVGRYAFDSCRKLTAVTIPPSVTKIDYHGFNYCDGLTSVVIPASVTIVGDYAFDCRGLKAVTISEGVESIGSGAFCACFELLSVKIPSSVKRIGKYAFSGCKKMTTVVMCGERPEIGEKAFGRCDGLKSIHVPPNAKSWAGMKEWQGIPLVFDAEAKK